MKMMKIFLTIYIQLFILNLGMAHTSYPDCEPSSSCKYSVENVKEFTSVAGKVDSDTGPQQIVKIVYKRDGVGGGRVYFVNTKQFKYHYDFSITALKIKTNIDIFNKNYEGTGEKREFNLASLIYHGGKSPKLLLELWNGDSITAKYLIELLNAVKAKVKLGPLFFHPLGIKQELVAVKMKVLGVKIITTSELFNGRKFQALNRGTAYGYVRLIEDNNTAPCLDHTTIPVYKKIPNEIGLVGGVITSEFQTPLSHINVKSMNRGTANMAHLNALKIFRPYNNRAIKLEVTAKGYKITPLDSKNAKLLISKFWQVRRPSLNFSPESKLLADNKVKFLNLSTYFKSVPSKKEHQELVRTIGAKATNLAVISAIFPYKFKAYIGLASPRTYGVPFNYYDAFMNNKQLGIDPNAPNRLVSPATVINEILNSNSLLDSSSLKSICHAKPILKRIRDVIQSSKVPESMLKEFKRVLIDKKNSSIHISKIPKFRLRSSTNSEDLEGFSGAGLYNSTGVSLYGKIDGKRVSSKPFSWKKIRGKLLKKIPYVYSSVWNDRAFEEREWFGISGKKHLAVKVGIAVHRAFPQYELDGAPGELANGVAVTKNIYSNKNGSQAYINSQHYELAVTNPPSREDLLKIGEDPKKPYKTEELLVTTYLASPERNKLPGAWRYWNYSYLSKSSIRKGAPVLIDNPNNDKDLRQMEIRRLALVLRVMESGFRKVYNNYKADFAIDVEWKIYGKHRLIWIKQSRPFMQSKNKH